MDELNQIILRLYENELLSDEIFLKETLDLIQPILPFDSAIWSKGRVINDSLSFHDCSFYNSDSKMQMEWEAIKQSDCFANCHNDHFVFSNKDNENCGKIYKTQNFIIAIYPNKFNNGFELLSLYKKHKHKESLVASEYYLRYLMPHLVKLYNNHQILTMAKSTVAKRDKKFQLAITNSHGILDSSETSFDNLMHTEWPTWTGPKLPFSLYSEINNKIHRTSYHGKNIVIYYKPHAEYIYLFARGRSEIDKLSTRELNISKLFSMGKTYKEIARHVNISPSTVRVHLHTVYGKLNINTKIQLVNILRQDDVGGIN